MHGYDGAKKVNGRKRHLLTDTCGIVLKAHVTAASTGDRDGAAVLLDGIGQDFPRLAFGWVDQGYRGAFLDWVRQATGITLQVAVRRDGGMRHTWAPAGAPPRVVPRFAVVPRRWVIERTFAWLGRFRRLAKDYEYLPATSENAIYLAMSIILLRRMTRPAGGRAGRAGPATATLAQQCTQPALADRDAAGLGQPAGQLGQCPDLVPAGGPGQQFLHGVQVAAVQLGRAAAAGLVSQPIQPTAGQPVDGPPDGGLIQAQVRADPGYRPAQIGQADAFQPPSQPRGERVPSQPLLQIGSLSGGKGNVQCHRSGHGSSVPRPRRRQAASDFSDTL